MARPVKPDAEQEVLDAVVHLSAQNGYPPSVRQIADHLGYNSVSSVYRFMVRLREQGRLEWAEGKARTIRVVTK